MEDEDVDGKISNIRPDVEDKEDSCYEESTSRDELKRKSSVSTESCLATRLGEDETVIKEKAEDKCDSEVSEDLSLSTADTNATTKVTFKGFKKRILSETRNNQIPGSRLNNRTSGKKTRESKAISSTSSEIKRGKITEYAQYLGLQPASNRANCANCQGTIDTCDPSMINQHRCTCPSDIMTQSTGLTSPGTSDSCTGTSNPTTPTSSSANNFRITRKVYLCAACGTYFENWNLFLHMRETHKRHICLFCLGMFGQAERLSYHLTKKHNVPETTFTSVEDFYNVFKGSCYLICCTCEKVFAETDNFYNHFCSPVQKGRANVTSETCSLCRQSVNNHSSVCSHTEMRDSSQSIIGLPGIPGIPNKSADSKTTVRGRTKRILKNNRIKRNELSPLTSYQKKMAALYGRKLSVDTREQIGGSLAENIVNDSSMIGSLESRTTTTTTTTTTASITTTTTTMTTTTGMEAVITTTTPIQTTETIATSPAAFEGTEMDSTNSHRDTVSETIMEVSKCMDDTRPKEVTHESCIASGIVEVNNTALKIASSSSPSLSSSSLPSPLRQQIDTSGCYDSVTETIMEVSRCYNENEVESSEDDGEDREYNRCTRIETSSRGSDADASIMDDARLSDNEEETPSFKQRYDDRLKNSLSIGAKIERRRKRRRTSSKRNEEILRDSDSEDASSSCDSEATIPSHDERTDTPTNTSRSRQDIDRERLLSESYSSPEKESQTTSVSFTTVNSTDRSLVIKICTNRNAQFSVTKNSANGNHDNHDTSRESEENNNGEDSGSEGKTSNHSERGDRDSVNSCHDDEDEDDQQSDANSVKLLVDDTKHTEEESRVDKDDFCIADETKDEIKMNEDETAKNVRIEDSTDAQKSDEKNDVEIKTSENDTREEDVKLSGVEGSDGIILASDDVPSIDLNVDGILESMKIEDILKRCISAASGFCVYCNHARHIAVNGKQLGLHVLAEHRFQPQHPAIIIQREQFIVVLKKSLDEVETKFFNLDSYDSANGTYHVAAPRIFECFHCRYHSLVHKEIYLHNRKMHQKTILICIMCKSTFYSYSELLCHLCPGVYSPNVNVTYRCCLCPVSNLPSAFRLMVHLRKRHHSCDVCLESTGNQQRLSNHVWKHKLHHLCYRCGIAYRNKPDITKHLFWKHGTESVLCKKCLQKKWPHVYHFCIPPTAFVCEECTSTFTRAVALKVHKRLHSGDRPHGCDECEERFISMKLASKHKARHREPEIKEPEIVTKEEQEIPSKEEEKQSVRNPTMENVTADEKAEITMTTTITGTTTTTASTMLTETPVENDIVVDPPCEIKETKEPVKKVVDVYDLPPLNLSSDSDSDVEETAVPESTAKDRLAVNVTSEEQTNVVIAADEEIENKTEKSLPTRDHNDSALDVELNEEEKKEEAQIMDGIWDNFKSYAASLGQHDTTIDITIEEKKRNDINREYLCKIILADHDYCVVYADKSGDEETKEEESAKIEDNCSTMEDEHDYGHKVAKSPSNTSVVLNCDSDTNTAATTNKRKKEKTPKKKVGNTSSSDSSSDSDSSSCSCGTNCSCSSSSSGSSSSTSSSSDSDSSASEGSPKKQIVRKERKRDKEKEIPASIDAPRNNSTKPELSPEKVEPETVNVENEIKHTIEDIAEPNIEINNRPPSPQLIFRESDLDTDETETDEDFYDEHPQQLANKILAEKRNQLMLLAAVAPPSTEITTIQPAKLDNLNNGTLETVVRNANTVEVATSLSVEDDTNRRFASTATTTRKRVKTKKRKKSDRAKTSKITMKATTPTVESIKLNIPKSFYEKKTKKFGSKGPSLITVVPNRSSTPSITNSTQHSEITQKFVNNTNKGRMSMGGSGSENENKRSSKRKRVPKRFYGDSSDDESQQQQADHHHHHHHHHNQQQQQHYNQPSLKWRKVEPPSISSGSIKTLVPPPPPLPPPPSPPPPSPLLLPSVVPSSNVNYGTKNVTLRLSGFDQPMERVVPIVTGSTEFQEPAETSTAESSENEETNDAQLPQQPQQPPVQREIPVAPPLIVPNMIHNIATSSTTSGLDRSVNLYCYCQCPYDEVSEMIACDGSDCKIEWFHFECVGIMVPPKGKWYCPDCRRKDSSLVNDDYLE